MGKGEIFFIINKNEIHHAVEKDPLSHIIHINYTMCLKNIDFSDDIIAIILVYARCLIYVCIFCLFSSPDEFQRNFPKGYLLIIQTCSNGILITPLMRMIRFFVVFFVFSLIKYSHISHLGHEVTVFVENIKNTIVMLNDILFLQYQTCYTNMYFHGRTSQLEM